MIGGYRLPTAYILERRHLKLTYNPRTKKEEEWFAVIKYNQLGRDAIIRDKRWLEARHPKNEYRIARVEALAVEPAERTADLELYPQTRQGRRRHQRDMGLRGRP